MQEIMQRFEAIERRARDPYAALEVERQDNHILFREGKQTQAYFAIIFVGVLAGGISVWGGPLLYPFAPTVRWLIFFSLFGSGSYLSLRVLFRQLRPIRFEIDTAAEELIVYPQLPWPHPRTNGPQRAAVSAIDYFFVRYDEDSDGGLTGAFYYVLLDGCAGLLAGGLGSIEQCAENNVKILGYLCDKPAYSVRDKTDVRELVVNYRTPWRNTDTWWNIDRISRDVMLDVADVLYDPQGSPADISKLTVSVSRTIFSRLFVVGLGVGGFLLLMVGIAVVASIWF